MLLENAAFILGWATVINYLLLVLWFVLYLLASDKIYQLHSRWFHFSQQQFSQLHYAGMMAYKLAIFLFLLTPYISLKFVPS